MEAENTKLTPDQELEQFFTRDAGNKGIEVPLFDPKSGKPSGFSLRIRSVDSDAFQEADERLRSKIISQLEEEGADPSKAKEIHEQGKLELISSLVISWTFQKPCTQDNIIELLRKAPQIASTINRLATKRHLFLEDSSADSTSLSLKK